MTWMAGQRVIVRCLLGFRSSDLVQGDTGTRRSVRVSAIRGGLRCRKADGAYRDVRACMVQTWEPQMLQSASVGDRRAARMAGRSPARAPMSRAAARPPAQAWAGMTAGSPWLRA